VMQMVKGHPMPEREDESFDFIKKIKEHFRKREKEIKQERSIRQEKAILVKAKLILLRQDGGISQLFAEAAETESPQEVQVPNNPVLTEAQQSRLELAEFYINDLGVWDMYQKFLLDRGVKPKVETTDDIVSEKETGDGDDDNDWFHSGEEATD
jgi:hypothetical protein